MFGDCRELLREVPGDSVDLVVTSPPYADARKDQYGGVAPGSYVEWFLPIADELQRVLTESGTFILNIKERVEKGQRHTYVLDLILSLRARGWLWTEEYIWHKKNSVPGKWPNRFRDGWERLLQFNKSLAFYMDQESVMIPVGDWSDSRLRNLSIADKDRSSSGTESGFGRDVSNWEGRGMVYPDNVLHMATECQNVGHSAAFPYDLPAWFIRLFSREGDTVLDPFVVSGTTLQAAYDLQRYSIGIENDPDSLKAFRARMGKAGISIVQH